MTPAQLDHLRKIDAHLANLLEVAKNRTSGRWEEGNRAVWHDCDNEGQNEVCEFVSPQDAAYIAACSNNAEAGWESVRATIAALLNYSILACDMQEAADTILARWPLELLATAKV